MPRIVRLHLIGQRIDLFLYVPVTSTDLFDPNGFGSVWPVAYGEWDKNDLFAEVHYYEDKDEIRLQWCDGDISTIPLRSGAKLGKGVLLRMNLVGTTMVYDTTVLHYDLL